MKNRITWSILAASLTFFTACGGDDYSADDTGAEIEVPTQDEADMAAEKAITEENADEELDKLMDEIGE